MPQLYSKQLRDDAVRVALKRDAGWHSDRLRPRACLSYQGNNIAKRPG
jgi:hypothetical protein